MGGLNSKPQLISIFMDGEADFFTTSSLQETHCAKPTHQVKAGLAKLNRGEGEANRCPSASMEPHGAHPFAFPMKHLFTLKCTCLAAVQGHFVKGHKPSLF